MEFDYFQLLKKARESAGKEVSGTKRFQMPVVNLEYQGRKTILRNFEEICEYLKRDKRLVARFLSRELASPAYEQGKFLIFQSNLQFTNVQKKLEKFVKEYVICKVCGQPDTKIVKERRIWFIKCEACGAKYPIEKI
ncbi:MAG: translation initiation factor IF-2 subunit beta [Candidatus Aenigmarchaeota archaeon ex4484_224]|nr:MAG: translation initiation factor IF-2 subunit beta [Candidatus Aenigmarchaeota archaeon ex4484_224]